MSELSALLADPPADLTLVHQMGLANAPDDPVGATTLWVTGDGALRLDWAHGRRSGRFTARVAAPTVARLFGILHEGGFPNVEWVGFPPGPSFRVVAVERGGSELAKVFLARAHYERTPPWDELCAILDSLTVQVRGPLPGLADTLEPVVTEVRPA